MLLKIIKSSFVNQKKAVALMIVSVAVGTAMAASLVSISFEISGKLSRELRAFGANILVAPKVEGLADVSGHKRYLRQEDIVKAKTIFWRHNIVGISPFLEAKAGVRINDGVMQTDVVGTWYEKQLPLPGERKTFSAGTMTVSPWWKLEGRWPDNESGVVLGVSLADRLAKKTDDDLLIDGKRFFVSGTLETGGIEDDRLFMDLASLQGLKNMHGKISKVLVSALTKPMDEFAYRDPDTMGQAEYEKWYCTGYVTSIAKQLEEVFQGSTVKPVWQVAETEGNVLKKLTMLIYFLTITALAAAALGVSTTMIMSLLRRVEEIGLMKAMGADRIRIMTIFISEGIMIGLIGGLLGYALSIAASQYISVEVFNTGFQQRAMLLPVAISSAVLISTAGTILPIRKALGIKPAVVLKGLE